MLNTNEIFLSPKQTGGPLIFALRQPNLYLAVERGPEGRIKVFDIRRLAATLKARREAGATWQEHVSLILLACCGKGLFEWLAAEGGVGC